jgi:hypothetical protein
MQRGQHIADHLVVNAVAVMADQQHVLEFVLEQGRDHIAQQRRGGRRADAEAAGIIDEDAVDAPVKRWRDQGLAAPRCRIALRRPA